MVFVNFPYNMCSRFGDNIIMYKKFIFTDLRSTGEKFIAWIIDILIFGFLKEVCRHFSVQDGLQT